MKRARELFSNLFYSGRGNALSSLDIFPLNAVRLINEGTIRTYFSFYIESCILETSFKKYRSEVSRSDHFYIHAMHFYFHKVSDTDTVSRHSQISIERTSSGSSRNTRNSGHIVLDVTSEIFPFNRSRSRWYVGGTGFVGRKSVSLDLLVPG